MLNVQGPGRVTTFQAPMDPTKPQGEACTSNGGLKEADEIAWFNDPDDESAMMGKSTVNRRIVSSYLD